MCPQFHPYMKLDIWWRSQIEFENAHRQKEQKKSFTSAKVDMAQFIIRAWVLETMPISILPLWRGVSSWVKLQSKSSPGTVAMRALD